MSSARNGTVRANNSGRTLRPACLPTPMTLLARDHPLQTIPPISLERPSLPHKPLGCCPAPITNKLPAGGSPTPTGTSDRTSGPVSRPGWYVSTPAPHNKQTTERRLSSPTFPAIAPVRPTGHRSPGCLDQTSTDYYGHVSHDVTSNVR